MDTTQEVVVQQPNNNTQLATSTGVTAFRSFMKKWSPRTKIDAILGLAFLSAASNKEDSDRMKKECYDFLSNRCQECANAVDPETGIEVTRVEKKEKVYNESAEVKKLEAQKKALEEKIKAAKEKAGVKEINITTYYKVKGL